MSNVRDAEVTSVSPSTDAGELTASSLVPQTAIEKQAAGPQFIEKFSERITMPEKPAI